MLILLAFGFSVVPISLGAGEPFAETEENNAVAAQKMQEETDSGQELKSDRSCSAKRIPACL